MTPHLKGQVHGRRRGLILARKKGVGGFFAKEKKGRAAPEECGAEEDAGTKKNQLFDACQKKKSSLRRNRTGRTINAKKRKRKSRRCGGKST